MTITTHDCKDFLVAHYSTKNVETLPEDWKRVSKYKENGIWIRDFIHPVLESISVSED